MCPAKVYKDACILCISRGAECVFGSSLLRPAAVSPKKQARQKTGDFLPIPAVSGSLIKGGFRSSRKNQIKKRASKGGKRLSRTVKRNTRNASKKMPVEGVLVKYYALWVGRCACDGGSSTRVACTVKYWQVGVNPAAVPKRCGFSI